MTGHLVDPADLVCGSDIAREFGVSPQLFQYLRHLPGFPEHVAFVGKSPLWLVSEVREWRATTRRRRIELGPAEHGTVVFGRNLGCRCPVCRTARNSKVRQIKADRVARLRDDPSLAEHGTASTYTNWDCRCVPCKAAGSVQNAEARARRVGRDKGERKQ